MGTQGGGGRLHANERPQEEPTTLLTPWSWPSSLQDGGDYTSTAQPRPHCSPGSTAPPSHGPLTPGILPPGAAAAQEVTGSEGAWVSPKVPTGGRADRAPPGSASSLSPTLTRCDPMGCDAMKPPSHLPSHHLLPPPHPWAGPAGRAKGIPSIRWGNGGKGSSQLVHWTGIQGCPMPSPAISLAPGSRHGNKTSGRLRGPPRHHSHLGRPRYPTRRDAPAAPVAQRQGEASRLPQV